jgi:glyoxylase-like metal-dependent hydrolase (beta-lactamase superfamily II)
MVHEVDYTIEAIRYGTIAQFPLSSLVVGSPDGESVDIAASFWLIRGGSRNVLFDCGFYRQPWIDRYHAMDLIRPDDAVRLAGVDPAQISDIILSHAHFDHTGGIDLFPAATLWIQEEEFAYYSGPAWQEGHLRTGVDSEDILQLVRQNIDGKLILIDGDDREILPGIRIYIGGRHTYASAYICVAANPACVLASDNCYLYRNLETRSPVKTFNISDHAANLQALDRMVALAGAVDRVIPGHDPLVFHRFPTSGRIAKIR